MQHRKLKWYERFQIEIAVAFKLVPSKDMTWKSWAFDPSFGLTTIGQEITTRYQLPESFYYGVDSKSVEEDGKAKKYKSLVFWLHSAIRILGFDFGFGIFYRRQGQLPQPQILSI